MEGIMPESTHRQGKKGAKIGRNRKKNCHIKYTSERRWIKNKALSVVRQIKLHPNWKPYKLNAEVKLLVDKYLRQSA